MLMAAKDDRLLNSEWVSNSGLTQRELAEKILKKSVDAEGVLLNNDGTRQYTMDENGEKVFEYAYGAIDNTKKVLDYISDATGNTYDFIVREQLSDMEIQAYLLNNCPIIVGYNRSLINGDEQLSSVSHAVVIVGYNSDAGKYLIQDPWAPQEGSIYELPYDEIIHHTQESDTGKVVYDWGSSIVYDIDILNGFEFIYNN